LEDVEWIDLARVTLEFRALETKTINLKGSVKGQTKSDELGYSDLKKKKSLFSRDTCEYITRKLKCTYVAVCGGNKTKVLTTRNYT